MKRPWFLGVAAKGPSGLLHESTKHQQNRKFPAFPCAAWLLKELGTWRRLPPSQRNQSKSHKGGWAPLSRLPPAVRRAIERLEEDEGLAVAHWDGRVVGKLEVRGWPVRACRAMWAAGTAAGTLEVLRRRQSAGWHRLCTLTVHTEAGLSCEITKRAAAKMRRLPPAPAGYAWGRRGGVGVCEVSGCAHGVRRGLAAGVFNESRNCLE